ncbi:hypothetical protein LWI29_023524 [Acer saccharum]|uniref:Uncharacterized protein n=1 Tax=Acer saccharum TaxID=4024 RepID=A0AA39RY50_ACESA|nr:hypothetical protein LWI29_023524 [Acer saccharum]
MQRVDRSNMDVSCRSINNETRHINTTDSRGHMTDEGIRKTDNGSQNVREDGNRNGVNGGERRSDGDVGNVEPMMTNTLKEQIAQKEMDEGQFNALQNMDNMHDVHVGILNTTMISGSVVNNIEVWGGLIFESLVLEKKRINRASMDCNSGDESV